MTGASRLRPLWAIAFPAGTASPRGWLLHLLCWIGVVAVCWQCNQWAGVERWLQPPWPLLGRFWLPLLALQVYALGWLGTGLWDALARRPELGNHPEVDAAWREAEELLRANRVNPGAEPLFLVLGPRTPELHALVESCGARAVLSRPGIPFAVYSHPDAIVVIAGSLCRLGSPGPSDLDALSLDVGLAQERHEGTFRLHHLCQLLARDRPGERAVQGIVLAIPLTALRADGLMEHAVACCQGDLLAVREATGLECPLYLAVTGAEGGPHTQREGCLQRFPLMLEGKPDQTADMLERELEQLCLQRIPVLCCHEAQVDTAPAGEGVMSEQLLKNIRLYQFVTTAPSWRPRLQQLLTEGMGNSDEQPVRIVGCYLLPAAPVPGLPVTCALWTDLVTHQRLVSWTAQSRAERDRQHRLTRAGRSVMLVAAACILAVLAWLMFG
jgi:hypothetical protein